jgi:hypothetical protein
MRIATVDGGSNGTILQCTVLADGIGRAVEGLCVIVSWRGFKALGQLGPIEIAAHPSGMDISRTTVRVLGVLDESDTPCAFQNPPSGTIIDLATDEDVSVFQDIYGIGWTLRHGIIL